MSAAKILSGLTMVCAAAGVTSACSPSFSDVDVKDGLEVRNACAVSAPALARVTERLNRAVKRHGLSAAQRVALATAANVMLHAAFSQADHAEPTNDATFVNFEPLLENLASQIRSRTDFDPTAEASKWNARYEDLMRRLSIARSADPTELQFHEAARRLDLDNASALLTRLLTEAPGTPQLSAARNYEAASIELLRFMLAVGTTLLVNGNRLQEAPGTVDASGLAFGLFAVGCANLSQSQPGLRGRRQAQRSEQPGYRPVARSSGRSPVMATTNANDAGASEAASVSSLTPSLTSALGAADTVASSGVSALSLEP